MRKNNMKAVTLVELLIVVLILVLLSIIAVPRKTRSAAAKACHTNIDVINSAIELYHIDNGVWPSFLTDVTNNTDYFLDGPPACHVSGSIYTNHIPANNKVDNTGHFH